MHALWAIVARRKRETGELIAPAQRVSRHEALQALTINGAYLTYEEANKGSIEPRKWADLVVLAEDLFEVDEERLKDIPIAMTIVGGQVVYEASAVSTASETFPQMTGAAARV